MSGQNSKFVGSYHLIPNPHIRRSDANLSRGIAREVWARNEESLSRASSSSSSQNRRFRKGGLRGGKGPQFQANLRPKKGQHSQFGGQTARKGLEILFFLAQALHAALSSSLKGILAKSITGLAHPVCHWMAWWKTILLLSPTLLPFHSSSSVLEIFTLCHRLL